MATADLEILKGIPGYKAILKAVLKSQIQMMVQQLSDHTGEESIILSASINDGSLSHLGSNVAKSFLEGREEIKSQFLSHCLKSHHNNQIHVQEPSLPYQESSDVSSPNQLKQGRPSSHHSASKRKKTQPVPLYVTSASQGSGSNLSQSYFSVSEGQAALNDNSNHRETSYSNEQPNNVLSDFKMENFSPTDIQTHESQSFSGSSTQQRSINGQSEAADQGQRLVPGPTDTGYGLEPVRLKKEPVAEIDEDIDMAGLQTGETTPQPLSDGWNQSLSQSTPDMAYDQSMAEGDSLLNLSSDQSGYDSSFYNTSMEKLSSHMESQFQQQQQQGESVRKGRTSLKVQDSRMVTATKLGNGYVKCNLCGKILRETSMASHKHAHLGIKNHECDYCGKKFSQKGPLVTHRRLHTGEKPYSCPRCQKSFTANSGLSQHAPRCQINYE